MIHILIYARAYTGVGQYAIKKNTFKTGFGGVYDSGSSLVAAQWATDNEVNYCRNYRIVHSNVMYCLLVCLLHTVSPWWLTSNSYEGYFVSYSDDILYCRLYSLVRCSLVQYDHGETPTLCILIDSI